MKRFISVMGWSKHHKQMDSNPKLDTAAKGPRDCESGYTVYKINPDGSHTNLTVDMSEPITLNRCIKILAEAERMTGNNYSKIVVEDESFDDAGETINRKHYVYSVKHNRLTIWAGKRGLSPVYENWDGTICKDQDALADCLL